MTGEQDEGERCGTDEMQKGKKNTHTQKIGLRRAGEKHQKKNEPLKKGMTERELLLQPGDGHK